MPPRITESTATLMDNILVKYNKDIIKKNKKYQKKYNKDITNCEVISGNLFCDISDHLPNFILYGKDK